MDGESPRISVILPTYNADSHLRRCLDSIFNQTFEDFELIVVDDGSTDRTLDILADYDDPRIRLIQRDDATGITSALNRGLDEARGEYIARHDADDLSHPERFERQVEYLDAHSEVSLVGTGAWLIDGDGRKRGRRRVLAEPTLDDLIEQNHYVHGSVLMRASALEAVDGYDEFFETTEDYDLWLRLADEFPVRNIDEPLYEFRIHDDSIYSDQMRVVKLYHQLAILRITGRLTDDLRRRVEEDGINVLYGRLDDERQFDFHMEMAQEHIRYGSLGEGREHTISAFRIRPSLMPSFILVLSFLGSSVVDFVARTYRSKVLNPRIAEANST